MRALRRWGAAILVATLVGTFGFAGPASAIPSGQGWSASWEYYLSDAFNVNVALPGGAAVAYASDLAGTRYLLGSVDDTDGRDRYCARVRVIATDSRTTLVSETACDGGQESFPTVISSEAVFVHLDLMQGNTIVKSTFTFVPSSADDATLRTPGTGTSWAYVNSGQYHLEVHRPGVDVVADGNHQVANKRSVLASVVDSGAAGSCAEGWATDGVTTVVGFGCGVGGAGVFSSFGFVGSINIMGCYYPPAATVRCLTMYFPEPH